MTTYNRGGQVVNVRDALTANTTYGYNGFGEQVSLRSADAGISGMSYDLNGNLAARTDARGAVQTVSYDALDRPLTRVFNGASSIPVTASETQSFTYDACPNGAGRLCSVDDHSGVTSYQYDLWGRVVAKTFTPAGTSVLLSVGYAYDQGGHLVATTYPSGNTLVRAISEGRIASLDYAGQSVLSSAAYRPLGGGLEGFSWGSFAGFVDVKYDLNGQIAGIEDIDNREYVRNAKGWLTGVGDALNPSADQLYGYDLDGHLKQANLAVRPNPIDYLLKGNSNITQRKVGPQAIDTINFNYTAAAANKLTEMVYANGPRLISYDRAGNMVNDGAGLLLTYDAKNRPRSSTWFGGTATSFAFNAFGQRMRKTHPGLADGGDLYVYDESGMLIGRYSASGQPIEELVYLEGRPVATVRSPADPSYMQIHPILTDHLGTPRKVLTSGGQAVWSWDSKDPYGNQFPNEWLGGGSFSLNLRFPGQWFDGETGLFHNGFRDYSAKLGRYVQPDPIGLAGGMNSYAYVGSNPLNGVDPLGLTILRPLDAEEAARTNHAIDWIVKNSVTAAREIKKMEDSPIVVSINIVSGDDSADTSIRQVYWNPRLALKLVEESCGTVSYFTPPSALVHELLHAFFDHKKSQKLLHSPNSRYDNEEELRVMMVENQISVELGEGRRRHHKLGTYDGQTITRAFY